MRVLVQD